MNISLQDYLAIVASILGPILTLIGFMWHYFNKSMGELKVDIKSDIKDVRADIKRVEEKVDAVRDRVSRIEGQLVPAKVISFEESRHHQGSTRSAHSKAAQAQ
jgi:hypothetical protein